MNQTTANLLLLGFCEDGPYRFARDLVSNMEISWLPWGYDRKYVHPQVIAGLEAGEIPAPRSAVFASWCLYRDREAELLRYAQVDHISLRQGYLSLTVFLGDRSTSSISVPPDDPYLCRLTRTSTTRDAQLIGLER